MPAPTRPLITPALAAECFTYNPETGEIHWRVRPVAHFAAAWRCAAWNTSWSGRQLGLGNLGYVKIIIRGYAETTGHRIAWMLMVGEVPPVQIDHIDGDRGNNRWVNLRAADSSKNMKNKALHSNNTSGHIGVSYAASAGEHRRWLATGSTKIIGRFATKEEAVACRARWALENGYHPNHGRPK